MITLGLITGAIVIFVCYFWNITDGQWPYGW